MTPARTGSVRAIIALVLLALVGGLATGRVAAHGDEDHSHDTPPAAAAPSADASQRLADGNLFISKPTQRQLGLRTRLVKREALAATLSFNGKVIADPAASGLVQAIQPGRVEPVAAGLPMLGQRVRQGQVLAWLRPATGSLEHGNQRARLAELDAEAAIAERRAQRLDQLDGAVPRKEIEAARLERDGLQKRRAAVAASLAAREPLRAPVSGVIAAAHVVAGQVVDGKEVLFEVIDPARLAVEALAHDVIDTHALVEPVARFAGGGVPLRFVGAGGQLREQALPLLFRIVSSQAGSAALAVGQPVQVIAKTRRQIQAVAVPRAALVKNAAGADVVWLHVGAERFAPRVVQWTPLDAETIAVSVGLGDGDRVVSEGAGLLAQMR